MSCSAPSGSKSARWRWRRASPSIRTRGTASRDTYPRFEDNVRVLRGAYRTLADDVRTGRFVGPAGDWLLDNFHLIAAEIGGIRRNLPRSYSRTLPALASREHAGQARIYADRRRTGPAQRQPARSPAAHPVPEQLSARRAADHRRAVGVAEHAEARADREPAPARRGAARRARGAPTPRTSTWRARTTSAASGRCPPGPTRPSSSSCSTASASTGCAWRRCAPRWTSDLAARQTTAEDAIRGEHQRQGVAQVSVANAITSLRLCTDARLAASTSSRSASWSRCCSAIRRARIRAWTSSAAISSARRSRSWRCRAAKAQVRVALKAVESARQAAAAASADARAAHVGYHLVDRGRADLEAELAFQPAAAIRIRRALVRARGRRLPRRDRRRHHARGRRRGRLRAPGRRDRRLCSGWRRCSCCCPRAISRSPASSAPWCTRSGRAVCPASTSPTACPRAPARW